MVIQGKVVQLIFSLKKAAKSPNIAEIMDLDYNKENCSRKQCQTKQLEQYWRCAEHTKAVNKTAMFE